MEYLEVYLISKKKNNKNQDKQIGFVAGLGSKKKGRRNISIN